MSFSLRLRNERELLGLKQKEFADKLNIPSNTYNGYETGKRTPSPDIITKIADYLDVSVDYLLGRTNFKTINAAVNHLNQIYNHEINIDTTLKIYTDLINKGDDLTKEYILKLIYEMINRVDNTYILKQLFLTFFSSLEHFNIIDKVEDANLIKLRNEIAHLSPSDEELESLINLYKLKK